MPTPSRFARSGNQIFQGHPVLIQRNSPLRNRGAFRVHKERLCQPLRWFGSACEGWLNALWDNNAIDYDRAARNNPHALSWVLAIDDNNPIP